MDHGVVKAQLHAHAIGQISFFAGEAIAVMHRVAGADARKSNLDQLVLGHRYATEHAVLRLETLFWHSDHAAVGMHGFGSQNIERLAAALVAQVLLPQRRGTALIDSLKFKVDRIGVSVVGINDHFVLFPNHTHMALALGKTMGRQGAEQGERGKANNGLLH